MLGLRFSRRRLFQSALYIYLFELSISKLLNCCFLVRLAIWISILYSRRRLLRCWFNVYGSFTILVALIANEVSACIFHLSNLKMCYPYLLNEILIRVFSLVLDSDFIDLVLDSDFHLPWNLYVTIDLKDQWSSSIEITVQRLIDRVSTVCIL